MCVRIGSYVIEMYLDLSPYWTFLPNQANISIHPFPLPPTLQKAKYQPINQSNSSLKIIFPIHRTRHKFLYFYSHTFILRTWKLKLVPAHWEVGFPASRKRGFPAFLLQILPAPIISFLFRREISCIRIVEVFPAF